MKLKILLFIFFALNFSFAQNQKQLSKKIDSIIAQQLPVSEKKRMSDIVIDSNGSIQSTIDATTMMVVNLGI